MCVSNLLNASLRGKPLAEWSGNAESPGVKSESTLSQRATKPVTSSGILPSRREACTAGISLRSLIRGTITHDAKATTCCFITTVSVSAVRLVRLLWSSNIRKLLKINFAQFRIRSQQKLFRKNRESRLFKQPRRKDLDISPLSIFCKYVCHH